MPSYNVFNVQFQNINDNEIITADYWNSIFGIGSIGSSVRNLGLKAALSAVKRRANCNVYNLLFNEIIFNSKRIRLVYNLVENNIYAPLLDRGIQFYNLNIVNNVDNEVDNLFNNNNTTNTEQVIHGLPFILICSFSVQPVKGPSSPSGLILPFPNNYLLRTTVERDYLKKGSLTELNTETIASNFFNIKNNDVGVGTITYNISSTTVTGVGTKFGDGDVGRTIYAINASSQTKLIGVIASVTNATTAILTTNASYTASVGTNYLFSEMGRANITTSMCYASQSPYDSHYITMAHSFSYPIRVVGNVRLIVNPGMV